MRRNGFIFLLILLCLGAATYLTGGQYALMGNPIPQLEKQESALSPAPDFKFTPLHGKTRKLSDLQGKVIVLNFWASWCPPCVQEFPQLLELAHQQKDKMVLLAISQDENPKALNRFLKHQEKRHAKNLRSSNVIVARDDQKKIARDLFQTVKLPETFLITPDGKIAGKIVGLEVDFSSAEMQQKIEDIYQNKR